jgi:hypothetical protein
VLAMIAAADAVTPTLSIGLDAVRRDALAQTRRNLLGESEILLALPRRTATVDRSFPHRMG